MLFERLQRCRLDPCTGQPDVRASTAMYLATDLYLHAKTVYMAFSSQRSIYKLTLTQCCRFCLRHIHLASLKLQASCRRLLLKVYGGERTVAMLGLPPAPSARHEYSSMEVTLEVMA
jgi:hypothetical protein